MDERMKTPQLFSRSCWIGAGEHKDEFQTGRHLVGDGNEGPHQSLGWESVGKGTGNHSRERLASISFVNVWLILESVMTTTVELSGILCDHWSVLVQIWYCCICISSHLISVKSWWLFQFFASYRNVKAYIFRYIQYMFIYYVHMYVVFYIYVF